MVRTFMVCKYPGAIHFYELHEEGPWFTAEKAGAYHLKEISESLSEIEDLETFAWVDLPAIKCLFIYAGE